MLPFVFWRSLLLSGQAKHGKRRRHMASVLLLLAVVSSRVNSTRLRADSQMPLLPSTILAKENEAKLLKAVSGYSESFRAEGLEGSVGSVPFDTPTKLQGATLALYEEVGKKVEQFRPKKSLSQILPTLPPVDIARIKTVPLIDYKLAILKKACPNAKVDSVGDDTDHDAYPRCLMEYMTHMSDEAKKELGRRSRELLSSPDEIRKAFSTGGVCDPVAALLSLPGDFCQRLLDVLISVPNFVSISGEVTEMEREQYGEEAVLLQMRDDSDIPVGAPSDTDVNSDRADDDVDSLGVDGGHPVKGQELQESNGDANDEIKRKIQQLQLRIAVKKMWNFLAISPLRAEAERLLEVWYNEPVHKWRYIIGLLKFFHSASCPLIEFQPQLSSQSSFA